MPRSYFPPPLGKTISAATYRPVKSPTSASSRSQPSGVHTSLSPRTSTQPRSTQAGRDGRRRRSEEHTSELQSRPHLVCRLLLEKKKNSRRSRAPACLTYSISAIGTISNERP